MEQQQQSTIEIEPPTGEEKTVLTYHMHTAAVMDPTRDRKDTARCIDRLLAVAAKRMSKKRDEHVDCHYVVDFLPTVRAGKRKQRVGPSPAILRAVAGSPACCLAKTEDDVLFMYPVDDQAYADACDDS